MKITDNSREMYFGGELDIYWAVPGNYTMGDRQETFVAALEVAIETKRAQVARHNEFYSDESTRLPLPELIWVDCRAKASSGVDAPILRFGFVDIADAEAALAASRA